MEVILQATLAGATDDDDGLDKISHTASRVLYNARERRGWIVMELPKEVYGGRVWQLRLMESEPQRGQRGHEQWQAALYGFRNRLKMGVRRGDHDDVAEGFAAAVAIPLSPICSFLLAKGIAIPGSLEEYGSLKALAAKTFKSILDGSGDDEQKAERCIVQGMKKLGLAKDKAESLFDFEGKQVARRVLREK
jgi:hypothetical protein